MRKLIVQLAALVMVLSACQKEKSLEDPNATPGIPGPPATGNRLIRTGTRLGSDTVTINYSYNAANSLTGITFSGMSQGMPFSLQQRINRNANNVITSVVVKSPLLLASGYDRDSLVTNLTYDAAAGRYVRSMSRFVKDNESLIDSTVYNYSTVGRLSSSVVYFSDGSAPVYFPYFKREYTFFEQNLSETRFYVIGGNDFELEEVTTFKHDSKVNPLPIPAEAQHLVLGNVYDFPLYFWFYLGLNDFFSVNNVSNSKVTYVSTSESEEAAVTYTYNAKNLPETATRTIDGIPFAVTTYYYQ